ncbi:unnamed protein product, partial [marine sediment metagenome]
MRLLKLAALARGLRYLPEETVRGGLVGELKLGKKPKQYDLRERIGFSRGVSKTGNIEQILLDNILGAFSISRASPEEDRHGTDFWVNRTNTLPKLSIDLKAREIDPLSFDPPKDDLALETYSNVANKTKGWTRDDSKRTDYILWFFKPTKRWVL